MEHHSYKTNSTCSTKIDFDLKDGKVYNVHFLGGCAGNLSAISKLIEGMEIEKVIALLEGTTCGRRTTSCSDQLTLALKKAQTNV